MPIQVNCNISAWVLGSEWTYLEEVSPNYLALLLWSLLLFVYSLFKVHLARGGKKAGGLYVNCNAGLKIIPDFAVYM